MKLFDYLTDDSKNRYNIINSYITSNDIKSINDIKKINNLYNNILNIYNDRSLNNNYDISDYQVYDYSIDEYKNIMEKWYKRHNLYPTITIKKCIIIKDTISHVNLIYGTNDINDIYYELLIKRLRIFVNLFTIKKNVNIYCYASDDKRNVINDRLNLNDLSNEYKKLNDKLGALTIAGETIHNPNTIFITKKEELCKLMIHEMIHLYELDEKVDIIDNNILNKWNVKITTNSYEAYTELISNLFIIICISIETKTNVYDLINIERIYSIYDTAKLLYLYNYDETNIIDFFMNPNKHNKIDFPIPALYYYIIRSMLFYYIDELFDDQYINNKMKALNKYNEIQNKIIYKTSQLDSNYMKLLINLLKNNKDNSLTYMCLDTIYKSNKVNKIEINYY